MLLNNRRTPRRGFTACYWKNGQLTLLTDWAAIYHSKEIYERLFSQVEAEIKAAAERDYPKAPDIDWKSFEVGCR